MTRMAIALVVILGMWTVDSPGQQEDETAGVRQVALEYIEGWYEGNAARMERAPHPDLAKRIVHSDPCTGQDKLVKLTAGRLVEFTAKGGGRKTPEDQRAIDIKILDMLNTTANVKVSSAKFIDYLHIVKWNGKWVILNAVWENRQ